MKRVKLLLCPFCGSKAMVRMEPASPPDVEGPFWVVACGRYLAYRKRMGTGCPAGPIAIGDSRDAAIDRWNTRIPQEASK